MENRLIDITKHFLKKINVSQVSDRAVRQALNSHPNFSTLLSISDSLNEWGIENYVVSQNGDSAQAVLHKYPLPFIAQLTSNHNEFIIVTDVSLVDETIAFYSAFEGDKTVKASYFFERWKRIALLSFLDKEAKEYSYRENSFLGQLDRVRSILTYGLLLLIIGGILQLVLAATTPLYAGLFLLKTVGLGIALLIFRYDFFGKGTNLVGTICATGKAKSANACSSVIHSKRGKIFGRISWSVLGLLYFSGSALAYLLTLYAPLPQVVTLQAAFTALAVLFIPYSLFFQRFVAKSWCLLCLLILSVFIGEGILLVEIFRSTNSFFSELSTTTALCFGLGMGLPTLAYLMIEPTLQNSSRFPQSQAALQRLKYRRDFLNTLLTESKQMSECLVEPAFLIKEGDNPEGAGEELVVVLNPTCEPCKEEFATLDALVEGFYPTLDIKVVIATSFDETEVGFKVGLQLHAIYAAKGKDAFRIALRDWYAEGHYERWFKAHGVANVAPSVKEKFLADLDKMYSSINYTPTVFFQRFELPEPYRLTDIKYLAGK